jgi:AraC-like DNA-binding protein
LYSSEEISDIANILISILNNPLSPTELLSDVIRTRLPKENEFSHRFVQYDYVDENYKRENEVLHYIETGNVEALAALSNLSYGKVNIPRRTKYDPLRDTKNLTIVLNSISARAAIKGGLSLHLAHSISTKYAIAIESQISSEGCYSLASNLLREYAECVRNYSLDKYPQLIKDALIIIRKNIASHIGLNDIAAKLHVSREHLCREFKREMGQNLTDYINELKINESLDLVKSKKYSVSDIAFIFGYSSSTYYSIVFKKIMGVPPSRYQA